VSESFDDILMNAMQAAQVEGLVTPSTESGRLDVHKESSEPEEPDSLVQEHLQAESSKEAQSTHVRMTKVALLALLTAGDSCLSVERVRHGR